MGHVMRFMCGSRGGGGGRGSGTPLKNDKNIGFLSDTGSDPSEIYKASKPAFKVGLSSACLIFKWRFADDDQLLVVFGSILPLSTKKGKIHVVRVAELDPL